MITPLIDEVRERSAEEMMRRALACLYIAVDESVAKNVQELVHAYVNELLEIIAARGARLELLETVRRDAEETVAAGEMVRDRLLHDIGSHSQHGRRWSDGMAALCKSLAAADEVTNGK